jgi:nickel-dependent lactate racemase
MRLEVPSGAGVVEFDVPGRNLAAVLSPAELEPAAEPRELIDEALETPIGIPSIELLATGRKSVVLLVDDQTRPTPAELLLPPLIERLGADKEITILLATGTHRPMTQEEIRGKLGSGIAGSYPVVDHEWDNEAALVDLGITPNGTHVKVNRLVVESDLCLGTGNIVPHLFAGWAGGAKIVQPGVCGAETTYATHLLAHQCPFPLLGRLENPVRREIEDVARKAGLAAIVNTVLDQHHSVVHVVAGDPEAAHRHGVELARSIWGVKAPCLADIVITSAYPIEPNYWQSTKALACAELLVKRGGDIILVSSCPEGLCDNEEHLFTLQSLAGVPARDLPSEARRRGLTDYAALAVAGVSARCNELARVTVVSEHLSEDDVALMGHDHAASIADALEAALRRQGGDATISVITHGGDIAPLLT